ncbi:ChuX/HutX family heme-like substrate-binding protein [Kordiimonas pumila]|uniref:ChuX/HutX family heme-like substrate-binding protein n=1 Tax=Kordiimonas pumila TaxID=2161677 RepID=A0ABV7D8M1_9PROT|nr:ChuX/HutX family heme-like substrate-binding protein [Kordiimonas pumila]
MKKLTYSIPFIAMVIASSGVAKAHSNYEQQFCATADEKALVTDFVTNKRPGKPLPVAARTLDILEGKVATSLPSDLTVGTLGSPEVFKKVWASVEAWGAETSVGLVFTENKVHTFVVPSLVPMTQPGDGPLADLYADNGNGIHSHVDPTDVKAIYAAKLPAGDGFTRTLSFYDSKGGLIWALIAGEANGKGEKAAIDGFEETWKLIASMPQACMTH